MILVFCPNGHVFESRVFNIGGTVRLRLRGNRETCPVCGAMAEIMDGEFDFVDGSLRLLSARQITYARLDHIRSLVQQLRSEGAPPDKTREAIDREVPGLAKFLPRDAPGLAAYLVVLIMLINLVQEWRKDDCPPPASPPTEQIVKDIIDAQRHTPTPQLPVTPPQPPATPSNPRPEPQPPATPSQP